MVMDIAEKTTQVANSLTSVRLDQMILNLAKGIAWGQYELDKVGVLITKMMGVPGIVNIGGEYLSMIEAGFTPSFYHFVDTILELKMEINIREEDNSVLKERTETSNTTTMDFSQDLSVKVGGGWGPATAEVESKTHFGAKSTNSYAKTVDTERAQKFSQDLSASSLMRTKLVPVPPPQALLERIQMIIDNMREKAKEDAKKEVDGLSFPDPAVKERRLKEEEGKKMLESIREELMPESLPQAEREKLTANS